MKKFICKHPWSHFEVNNPNGDLTMCCNNNTVLGNVNDADVETLWNGGKFQAIRQRMLDEGAHAMCPHTCPVLHGGKLYEDTSWFHELEVESPVRKNAEANEREFTDQKTVLTTLPRWFRFTYSYACNLDCYHCYQREDAKVSHKLPDSFMADVPKFAKIAQVVFPFGGEPFFFAPVKDLLDELAGKIEGRFFFITNATLLTDRIFAMFEKADISTMAVSLDAASAESFDTLRVRGRNANWEMVTDNLAHLKELKQRKGFHFMVSMTVNSINSTEIESFVDLALAYDAEPTLLLVASPDQTATFQNEFLTFSKDQVENMLDQIDRSILRMRDLQLIDPEKGLVQLRATILQHCVVNNRPVLFSLKSAARRFVHALPAPLQNAISKIVQAFRVRQFESLRNSKS
jgi:molybdenum cofactor biosynthesis enzyme MoaA